MRFHLFRRLQRFWGAWTDSARPPARAGRPRVVPRLEVLEDRTATAVTNGKIAFVSTRPNAMNITATEIWVMNQDGTNVTQLTNPTTDGSANTNPSWSPD